MATLERIAPHSRAILAAHVSFQLVDRRRLVPPHDVERHGLMRVTPEAADFEIGVPGVQGIAQRRRWLGRSLVPEHTVIPRFAGELVSFLTRLLGTLH